MCQLTFADLGNLNKLFFTTQLMLNSSDNNKDGCGIISAGRTWKTKVAAHDCTNFGICIKSIVTNQPTVGHVRNASNKTTVTDENAHPFVGSKIILAHNGKLEPKDTKQRDYKKVDTVLFLELFEAYWLENPNLTFPEALAKFMVDWEGKFALMVYEIETKDFYIVRGASADLYYTHANDKLIVNTSKKCLDNGLHLFNQLQQLTTKSAVTWDVPKEIDKESIFKFMPETSTLEKVGEVKENKAIIPIIPLATSNRTSAANPAIWGEYDEEDDLGLVNMHGGFYRTPSDRTAYIRLRDFCEQNMLSLHEVNTICKLMLGVSLVELDTESLDILSDAILPKLAEQVTTEKKVIWKELSEQGLEDDCYLKGKLTFPWMLASLDELVLVKHFIQESMDN